MLMPIALNKMLTQLKLPMLNILLGYAEQVVTTPSEVTAAANQVNSAKQELNGDERLNERKQNANTAIDVLTQLNTPQKAKLKEQVGQANRLEDVQTVQTNGQALNNAMKGLRDSIANETTVKASQNYTDASPNNQSTYNSAVSQCERYH